jgi:hypothetical protein
MGTIRKATDILNYKEKKRAFLLFLLIFVMLFLTLEVEKKIEIV